MSCAPSSASRSRVRIRPIPSCSTRSRSKASSTASKARATSCRIAGSTRAMPSRSRAMLLRSTIVPAIRRVRSCFSTPAQKFALVGDVIFRGSIGRTDFPYGDHAALISAIKTKLFPLGDDIAFICGHGPPRSIRRRARDQPVSGVKRCPLSARMLLSGVADFQAAEDPALVLERAVSDHASAGLEQVNGLNAQRFPRSSSGSRPSYRTAAVLPSLCGRGAPRLKRCRCPWRLSTVTMSTPS
jgi:hypothetical protein